jgi:hypothetical protein
VRTLSREWGNERKGGDIPLSSTGLQIRGVLVDGGLPQALPLKL